MEKLAIQVQTLTNEGFYDEAVEVIANALKLSFKAEFLRNGYHFPKDTSLRDIYKITLTRGTRQYVFNFGQSIADSQYYFEKETKRSYTMDGKGEKYSMRTDYIKSNLGNFSKFIIKPGKAPSLYSVLACLQKYDVGSFEDFCDNFGYSTDSMSAETIYLATVTEYKSMAMLFSDDELEILNLIS